MTEAPKAAANQMPLTPKKNAAEMILQDPVLQRTLAKGETAEAYGHLAGMGVGVVFGMTMLVACTKLAKKLQTKKIQNHEAEWIPVIFMGVIGGVGVILPVLVGAISAGSTAKQLMAPESIVIKAALRSSH